MAVSTNGSDAPGIFGAAIDRIDVQGQLIFFHDNIELAPNDTLYLNYASWSGEGGPMTMEIDRGSDGTIEEVIELSDD